MKVRLGIDVGGTFTDAVAIDNDTYELIGYLKIPTTHGAATGVAAGIVEVIRRIMEKYSIAPEDVAFIAHGTTQATNALLEGDVARVGVVGTATGAEGMRAKADTSIGDIELATGKFLRTASTYVDAGRPDAPAQIARALDELGAAGSEVVVAAGAFSVDDPSAEQAVLEQCTSRGVPSTGSHEISKLYGLKIRTRTAAINASILPKMIETAEMTDSSVKASGIGAALMIMRCDGGVMDVQEVKRRPVLTMLSGPAAGVAGALMYERVSDGIFLEVGGTSTDISVIKNGKVQIKYAEVGGHKTYVSSLDVHTVGIAGGSMIRVGPDGVVDAGPRSAHIANLPYACYTDPVHLRDPQIRLFQPKEGDPADYAALDCADGTSVAITVSCAANYLGYIHEDDYAYGDREAAGLALSVFAERLGISTEEFARQIMAAAAAKNRVVVDELIAAYDLDPRYAVLVGGGGGAAAIVPQLAESMGMQGRLARNAEVISPIGVALAMVRDMVERVVLNPTDDDILRIRQEAFDAAVNSGANPQTVEVAVEVDTSKNIVRAVATGSTELRTKDLMTAALSLDEVVRSVAGTLQIPQDDMSVLASTGRLHVLEGRVTRKRLMGLLTTTEHPVRVVDDEGVIQLQRKRGQVRQVRVREYERDLGRLIDDTIRYSDGGEEMPDIYLVRGRQLTSFTNLTSRSQILSLAGVDFSTMNDDDVVFALGCQA